MEDKFYIIDTDLEIIDSSNNMLALKLDCIDLNDRFYSIADACQVVSKDDLIKLQNGLTS